MSFSHRKVEQQMENLFNDIKALEEDVDQSREEVCCHPLADESITNKDLTNNSIESISKSQKHFEKHQLTLEKQLQLKINQLKTINKKLFSDNRELLKECIRLRSKSSNHILSQEDLSQNPKEDKMKELQIQNLHYANEINKLRTENLKLKAQIYGLGSETKELNDESRKIKSQINILLEKFQILDKKIDETWKHEAMKKSSSFYSTTQESKYSEKDRQLTSLKATYESQITNLKQILQNKQREITQLKQVSPRRQNQSPRIQRPSFSNLVNRK